MSNKAKASIWGHVSWDIGENHAEYPDEDGYFESILDSWEARDEARLAKVSIKLGNTVQVAKYNSVRVDVGIELPAGVDEIEDAYEFGKNFCKGQLKKITRSVEKSVGKVDSFEELIKGLGDDKVRNRRNQSTGRRRTRRSRRSNKSDIY